MYCYNEKQSSLVRGCSVPHHLGSYVPRGAGTVEAGSHGCPCSYIVQTQAMGETEVVRGAGRLENSSPPDVVHSYRTWRYRWKEKTNSKVGEGAQAGPRSDLAYTECISII